jgi:hypothetical protein
VSLSIQQARAHSLVASAKHGSNVASATKKRDEECRRPTADGQNMVTFQSRLVVY